MDAEGALAARVLTGRTRPARGLSHHVLVVVHQAEVALAVTRLQVRPGTARHCGNTCRIYTTIYIRFFSSLSSDWNIYFTFLTTRTPNVLWQTKMYMYVMRVVSPKSRH